MSGRSFILRDANVLDEGGGFSGPLDVLVEDGLVAAIDDGLPASEAPSVDCAGLGLLPGIFDCHDHLTMSSLDLAECLAQPVSAWALEAARNARLTLEAGVTFVRDLAGADAGIREAFA
ncbi:MAG: amidohydrolase family protein, partial [Gaiellaceae bacterium]